MTNPLPSATGNIDLDGRLVPFSIHRSKRRKRSIAFLIEPPGDIKITAPWRTSHASIIKIVQTHNRWLLRKLKAFQTATAHAAPCQYADGDLVRYLGHSCTLRIRQSCAPAPSCLLRRKTFHVALSDVSLSETAMREEIKLELMLWMKKRARAVFRKRLDYWAGKLGLAHTSFALSKADRRWGSCSAQNDIRLNWRLILAPLEIIDYVVVHELCHIAHKNHGPRFWGLVAAHIPDYKQRRQNLKAIGQGLVL